MKIPNPFRRWIRKGSTPVQARYEGAAFSRERSWLPGLTQDAINDITAGDRIELTRRFRYFEKNSPLVQQILDLVEQNVVGTGVNPTPASSSATYNAQALNAWAEWCKFADKTSRQHFYTLEAIIVRAQFGEGEIFCHLTEGESGKPRVQLIESHRVRSAQLPPDIAKDYEKYIDVDGVLIDASGRPQFYLVQNDITATERVRAGTVSIIPADRMVHFFEPARAAQYRGITSFHSVLITLHDLDDLQRYEMAAAKDAAMRANVITTENGEMPDTEAVVGRPRQVTKDDGTTEDRKAYYEQAFAGKSVVIKKGDKWEQAESLRPSAAMREFWEYLTEQVCRGVGISYAAIKGYQGWGGAALRGAITSDNRFYEVRTNTLATGLQRIYEYVIGWNNDQGFLGEVPADWRNVRWQPPRRATVDIGRESAALLNELRAGARCYRDILGELGLDWKDVLRQRAQEEAFIDELAGEYQIDRARIAALGPNERQPVPMNPDPSQVTAVLASDANDVEVRAFSAPMPIEMPEDTAHPMPTEMVWMPAGSHEIAASMTNGETFRGKVLCDEAAAKRVKASFDAIKAAGRRVWIDFNHEEAEAAAWVKDFTWDPSRGIVCQVEWTCEGEEALREKIYYSFSPAFRVGASGLVEGLLFGRSAGGLVNKPAFGAAMPALVAARLGGAENTTSNPAAGGIPANQQNTTMPENQTEQVAATAATTPAEVQASTAAVVPPAVTKADLDAFKAEILASLKPAAVPASTPVVVAPGVAEKEVRITATPNPIEGVRAMLKETNSRKRGEIYCSHVRPLTSKAGVFEVLAANSLGTAAGDLVVLRALDLLKLTFPALSGFTTDFSADAAKLNQNITTRIVSVPSVGTYNTTTGYGVSDATTTDVTVKIDAHKHITIGFRTDELGGTNRDLFGEQVEAMQYAFGKDLVDAVYALFTLTNYDLAAQKTVKATADFDRKVVRAMAKAMNLRGVNPNRMLILNGDTHESLANDSTILTLAAYQQPEVIQGLTLPRVSGFQPVEAPNLPANSVNLTGIGIAKDAACIATRLPADYLNAIPGAGHGASSVVTNPDTGVSVQKVDFVDHTLGKAFSRIAWMRGVAVGQKASAQLLVSS